jgi:23S rRNA (guanosine2251-2'-O)-methyltransferase
MTEKTIEGKNSVIEALRAEITLDKIMIEKGKDGPGINKIKAEAKNNGVVVQTVDRRKLEQFSEHGDHQGVIAIKSDHEYHELEDIYALAEEKGEDLFIVILDHIVDPHNLGAIIRNAHLSGAHGVIIPKRRAAPVTATAIKASSGASLHTPIVRVTNISQTISALKEKGLWIGGADSDGINLYKHNLTGPLGIVIGNEGKGISQNIRKQCDFIISIPMYGSIDSYNASSASAIILAEAAKQRH